MKRTFRCKETMSPLALQSWSSASKKLVRADRDIRVASITCPVAMMMRMVMIIDHNDNGDDDEDGDDH